MIRRILVAATAALLAGCGTATAQAPEQTTVRPVGLEVTVSDVIDGDTVHAVDEHGARVKVRILGIDTPETRDPRKPVQCWGPEATTLARDLLLNQRVTLVTDPTQDTKDRYGRVLGYLYLPDGRNYSEVAAREGTARAYVYDRPVAEHAAIAAAEAEARAAGRGLWGACPS